MDKLPELNNAAGHAALAIYESLLLAITDLKITNEQNTRDPLTDAAAEHCEASIPSQSPELHRTAIVERILDGKDVGGGDQNAEAYAGA